MLYYGIKFFGTPRIKFAHSCSFENYNVDMGIDENVFEISCIEYGEILRTYDDGSTKTVGRNTILSDGKLRRFVGRSKTAHCHHTFALTCNMEIRLLTQEEAAMVIVNDNTSLVIPETVTSAVSVSKTARLIAEIIKYHIRGDVRSQLLCLSDVYAVLAELCSCSAALLAPVTTAMWSDKIHVERIEKYIAGNFKRKLTIDEIAESEGLSRSYVSRIFKKTTGQTIIEYVNERRTEYMKELIEFKEMSASRICEQFEISDEKYLYRIFKKHTGMTLGEYKKAKKGAMRK